MGLFSIKYLNIIIYKGCLLMTTKLKKIEHTQLCKGNGSILNCLGDIKESEFYNVWTPFLNGKSIYCKECCDKIFKYYYDETQSEKIALYYTLMKIDVPFIREIFEIINDKSLYGDKNGKITPISVGAYISELNKHSSKKQLYTDFSATDVNVNDIETTIKTREVKQQEMIQLEKNWGKQDEIEDYDFLEDTFNRYTQGVEFINPQQIDLYRDLCRDRLLLRKINDNRYNGDESIDKVQNRISKTMSTLKVDQFESNKPKTLSEQCMFTKIAQIEQTKPADLYKEPKKYQDFNGVKKYYKDLVLRPLLNTLVGNKDFNIDIEDIGKYDIK